MKITFHGAAQSVTGSKHLIETEGFRILLDCGLHQGGFTPDDDANRILPFDAAAVDCVILSHAHADHCGMLPVLVKNGFKGKIYCTGATADIARYILLDSAMVQEQDLAYAQKHRVGNGGSGAAAPAQGVSAQGAPAHPPRTVSYTKDDVEETLKHFVPIQYFRLSKQWTQINERVRFKFYDAGHILGSAITCLEVTEGSTKKTLVYTGDIGQAGAPILHDPEVIAEHVDVVISEATYGNRTHRPLSDATAQLEQVIEHAEKTKGKIVVPAFALGRTQEIVYILHNLIDRGLIDKIPMYVDSPLALNISEVFQKHTEDFNMQAWKDFGSKDELALAFSNLRYVTSVDESKSLNAKPGPFMVISSSGMMEGGRILHHLKNTIENPDNTVLITGYQAEGTLGRRIQNGVSPVKILDAECAVRANVITMEEFSAHADQAFLSVYIRGLSGLKQAFLVHTEMPQAEALRSVLVADGAKFDIEIPALEQSFEV